MQITTNHHRRPLIHGYELTETERKDFDYLDWSAVGVYPQGDGTSITITEDGDAWTREFFRYQGRLYDLGEAMELRDMSPWESYFGETYFSSVVIRFPRDDDEIDADHVIVGLALA